MALRLFRSGFATERVMKNFQCSEPLDFRIMDKIMDEACLILPTTLCECENTWSLVAGSLENKPAGALCSSALGRALF